MFVEHFTVSNSEVVGFQNISMPHTRLSSFPICKYLLAAYVSAVMIQGTEKKLKSLVIESLAASNLKRA